MTSPSRTAQDGILLSLLGTESRVAKCYSQWWHPPKVAPLHGEFSYACIVQFRGGPLPTLIIAECAQFYANQIFYPQLNQFFF